MHLTVGGEGGFARCQVNQVHDEYDEQAAVAGVICRQQSVRAQLRQRKCVVGTVSCDATSTSCSTAAVALFGHADNLGQQLLG